MCYEVYEGGGSGGWREDWPVRGREEAELGNWELAAWVLGVRGLTMREIAHKRSVLLIRLCLDGFYVLRVSIVSWR